MTTMNRAGKITDFLTLEIAPEKLAAALEVLTAFKRCESKEEWLAIPFSAWSKLEQLEEFLQHRVNGTALCDDTVRYMRED
jgi:hypothetical protein